jgi:hypothetical protein
MAAEWYRQQIKNNNYLSPIGFKFIIEKSPKTSYLCQTASIPEISVGEIEIPTPFLKYPIEGNFKYSSLSFQFLVDEDLDNYLEIHNWMRALGVPYSYQERTQFEDAIIRRTSNNVDKNIFSDGTLQVLTNNLTSNFDVVFTDMFPVSLSTLDFDATIGDNNYLSANVTFRYTYYEIRVPSTTNRKTKSFWDPEGS